MHSVGIWQTAANLIQHEYRNMMVKLMRAP